MEITIGYDLGGNFLNEREMVKMREVLHIIKKCLLNETSIIT